MKTTRRLLALLLAALMLTAAACAAPAAPVADPTPEATPEATPDVTPEPETDDTADEEANVPEYTNTDTEFNVGTLKGPSSLGLLSLLGDDVTADGAKVNTTIAGAPDEMVAKILSGELDAVCVPVNLAPVLYKKTEGAVQLAAVSSKGMLYLIQKGEKITSVADLKGKTVYSAGQGSTPEYVLNHLLRENGLEPGTDVTVNYMSEQSEVAAKIIADGGIVLVPEPFVTTITTKAPEASVALDITKIWNETTGKDLMMTVFVVNKEYAANNKGIVNDYLAQYEQSVAYTTENVADAAKLAEEYGIIAAAAIAEKAIPLCNITYLDAVDAKESLLDLYQVFFDSNPASVGGAIPDEEFWYNK